MKVEVVCDPDCRNLPEARAQLLRAFAETGISPRWIEWNRDSKAAPIYVRAFGSPTVLVNGQDVAEQASTSGNACCRLYPDASGNLRGAPSVEQIVVALKASLDLHCRIQRQKGGERLQNQAIKSGKVPTATALVPKLGKAHGLYISPFHAEPKQTH
jgi:hypothetical protein